MTQPEPPLSQPAAPSRRPGRSGLLADLRRLTPAERGLWRLPLMWAAAAAILFIPIIYVAVYLGSVWDPYGQLTQLPVGLVNLDAGTTSRGQPSTLGRDLIEDFHRAPPARFVRYPTEAAAQRAVRRGEVYFALTLPADFSRRAIAGSSAEHGQLRLYSAEGTSYFASRVGASIANSVALRLNERLGSSRWTSVQASLTQVQQGFADLRAGAARLRAGAGTLATGTGTLDRGAQALAAGAAKAAQGAQALQTGAQTLSGGVSRLTGGVGQLSGGLRQLNAQAPGAAQLQPLQKGAQAVAQGAAQLAAGFGPLVAGADRLSSGAASLKTGLQQANAGAGPLAAQLPAFATGLTSLQSGATSLATGAADLQTGATKLNAGLGTLGTQAGQLGLVPAQLSAVQGALAPLAAGAGALAHGAGKLQGGAGTLAQGLSTAQAGAARAATGAAALDSGTAALQTGGARLQSGAAQLVGGLNGARRGAERLRQGTASLNSGLETLVAGNLKIKSALGTLERGLPTQSDLTALNSGAQTLAARSGELVGGVTSLRTGAASLSQGTRDAHAGAVKLRDGLDTLYRRIPATVQTLGGDPAGLSASVQVVTQTTARVGNNGSAFSPYFIALGLWVGCTLTTFIFPYLLIPKSARQTGQLARVLRKFALPAGYVVAQALLVMLGVHLLSVPFLHPVLAVFTAVAASLTFMLLVLGLNLLLGAAGRLLALVLLVIQLAASGGSYPTELSSPFFQWLHTYLPVTDAINAMRYALFGSYEGQYGVFMLRMGLVALVSLGVALLSRRRWQYIADERFRSPLVLDVG